VPSRILILGGTGEARELALVLMNEGHDVITSLAGRTTGPLLPAGRVRVGGFGGAEGLARFILEESIDVIADATHPFAAQISAHGYAAAQSCHIRYVRLERPAWRAEDGDAWTSVKNTGEAAAIIPREARVLLTIGRKEISPFVGRQDLSGVIRMIEPLEHPPPARWTLLLARPPFTAEQEKALMHAHDITVLVTKNAGGEKMASKLQAARELKVSVVMVERPQKPPAETAATPETLVKIIPSGRHGRT
jgi:precorrin-6A/cobalt-precorrin-6A reductase